MKKLLVALQLLFISQAFAQKLYEPNYGLVLNGNFSIINPKYDNYVSRAAGSFGVYYQRPFSPYHSNRYLNRLDFIVEPAITSIGFRDNGSDKKFKSKFVDLSFYVNYVPDQMSDDLRLFLGVRPSILTYTSTSILEFGAYRELSNDSQNLNTTGSLDFAAIAGVSVNLGEVATFELKYAHSFTNKTNSQYFLGRPSTIEFGLRFSAVRIRDKIQNMEVSMQKELNKRAQGTLFVMLEEPDEKLIKLLVEEKRIEDAEYVRRLQQQTNLNIIKEFKNNFDFCKVEFFMSSNADKVNRGDFKGVLVDEFLNPKADIIFDTTNYFLASFIEDVSIYTKKADYGLYLYDPHFIQLGAPYNSSVNSMGIFVGGDPMNYFRRVKTSGYYPEDFRKIIKKVNSRLQLGRM